MLMARLAPEYSDVKITTLPPAKRVYGGEADAADKAEAANKKGEGEWLEMKT